ncbi:MAG: hypothetical protein LBQ22_04870 [Bacteroidales bacterium]|jgi:hypothetical protein|nr:hypothetical protein [Bacteroidales bacterium]
MKKLIYLIAAVMLISCSKDNDFTNNPNDIIGTWKLECFYRDERIDDSNQQIDIDNAEQYTKIDAPYLITFIFADLNECGLIEKYADTDYSVHTYKINGDNINISEICEKNISTGVFTYHSVLGYPIKYKFKNGKLILGSLINVYDGHMYNVAIYAIYKRK